MRRTYIIAGIMSILVLLGFGGWYLANSLERERQDVRVAIDETKPCSAHSGESANMFANIKGEEFDKAFIVDMLAHHEGAVNMAEGALAATDRPEIRTLATEIIEAQSKEIAEMRTWQKEWGYPVTAAQGHAGHGGNPDSMSDSMTAMTDGLRGLTDEVFDQKFLELMIEHHQQAVDMAKYAETNAYHPEIKELGGAIISAQETEIATMKEWQKSWGFPVSENKNTNSSTRCEL